MNRSLQVTGQAEQEGSQGHQTQSVALPSRGDYHPVPSFAVLSGTSWAQGFLAGWQEGASLFSRYTTDRTGCRTLGPQWLQPLVVELTHLAEFCQRAADCNATRGYSEGLIGAYDSAFGVSR